VSPQASGKYAPRTFEPGSDQEAIAPVSTQRTSPGTHRGRQTFARVVPLVVPLVFAVAAVAAAAMHDTFEEWDGICQVLTGREILAGKGYQDWASHFWPPLYSLLSGLLSLGPDPFWAAKSVSLISGVALLVVVYYLARALSSSTKAALLSQALVATTPLFFVASIMAENHMIDSLFFVLALVLLLRAMERKTVAAFAAVGVAAALACMSRYTSYALLPTVLLAIALTFDAKGGAKMAAAFLIAFVCVSLPWYLENLRAHGSALHTWHYLTAGVGIFRSGRYQWWWSTSAQYSGMLDLVRDYPGAFAKNWLSNTLNAPLVLMAEMGFVAALLGAGVLYTTSVLGWRRVFPLFGGFAVFVVFVSEAYFFDLILLSWLAVFAAPSAVFLARFPDALLRAGAPFDRLTARRAALVVAICILVGNLGATVVKAHRYIAGDDEDGGQLAEVYEVTAALREADPDIAGKYVMAAHPAFAYYAGSRYLSPALYYQGSVEEWCSFRNLPPKVLRHGFNYPVDTPVGDLQADYLVFSEFLAAMLPQFSFLLDPDSRAVPDSFSVVYRSPRVVAYRIAHD
jgi:hypothetical protein